MLRKKKRNNNIGLYVEVIDNNIDLALKQLKQRVKDSDLMIELREKAHYQKPSAKRRQTTAVPFNFFRKK
jgi:ribosomal protein S21